MSNIRNLLAGIETIEVRGSLDIQITGITQDSRQVNEGNCFIAISGYKDDGNKYIDDAVSKGAILVISETSPAGNYPGVTWVRLKDIRKAFATISLNFYGDPLKDKYVVGVTGTNGKTTVVALIDSIFRRKMRTVKFGTLGAWCGMNGKKASLTTPEANDIYKFLAEECSGDFENVIMEVSSVALELDRVTGIDFSQAIFTNLSGDHLDFHYNMENYFDSKLLLFRSLTPDKWAILNIDDKKGKSIIEIIDSKYITFGFSSEADVKPVSYKLSAKGIKALIGLILINLIFIILAPTYRQIANFTTILSLLKAIVLVKGSTSHSSLKRLIELPYIIAHSLTGIPRFELHKAREIS